MAIPEVARGAILDVNRLLRFRNPVNDLVLYDAEAAEIVTISRWWNLEAERQSRSQNAEVHRLRLVDDYDDAQPTPSPMPGYMSAVKTLRYVDSVTSELSDPINVTRVEKPLLGANREWVLTVAFEKFKGRYFTAG